MRNCRSTLGLASIAGLLLIAGSALAEDVPPPAPKRAEFCKQNPQQCEQMKQRRAERRAFCEKNPEKCAQQREQMQKRREEFRAKCEADPAKCEQMKQERRERFQKRHGAGSPPGEGAPLPPE